MREVRKTTTVSLSTRMNSVCASQIRLRSDWPFLRNAPTDGHTDRHLSFIYIYIYVYMIVITAYSCIKAYVVFMPDLQGKGERSGSPSSCTQTCPAYAEGLARETTNFFGRGYDLSWIYNKGVTWVPKVGGAQI